MLYIKEEHLEQKKQRQLRENIEEYLANSFCTMQTELELLEKHVHQNPESPTYSMDSEMLRDISLRLRAMADVSSSMAAILQGDADELRARTRALPFAERLRLFCERVNWEMKDLGYAGRTMYCTESPDICVLGDPVFMEAVLVNLILGMLKLENGSGFDLIRDLADETKANGVDLDGLIGATEAPVFEKYDEFIPSALLRKAFREDKLRSDEMIRRLQEFAGK